MTIRFDDKVAIVTGAGGGLGRSHALGLAARGAKVLVNDLGGALDGTSGVSSVAQKVVDEIIAAGGEAMTNVANVTDAAAVNQMVEQVIDKWGRIDILVNNAGILRDKSFTKMPLEDFRTVVDVHLLGAANCTKAVWEHMKEQQYGRIVMTTSSSGIYGNFGQANYGAAKMGLVGFMNTLCLEGLKYGIKINSLAPAATTRMTEELMEKSVAELLTVDSVTAGLLYLVSQDAPSRLILCAGAGGYAATRIYETEGIYLPPDQQTPENVALRIEEIIDSTEQQMFEQGVEQSIKFINKAIKNKEAVKV